MQTLTEQGQLLRIFIGESDKKGQKPLYEWIIQQARRQKMAGATILRGIQGFGAHSLIHTTKILRLSEDLPIIVEVVDIPTKIEAFLELIEPAIGEGLVTVEKAHIRIYRHRTQTKSPHSG